MVLKNGSKGNEVKVLQAKLEELAIVGVRIDKHACLVPRDGAAGE
jgi:hypothetical protein